MLSSEIEKKDHNLVPLSVRSIPAPPEPSSSCGFFLQSRNRMRPSLRRARPSQMCFSRCQWAPSLAIIFNSQLLRYPIPKEHPKHFHSACKSSPHSCSFLSLPPSPFRADRRQVMEADRLWWKWGEVIPPITLPRERHYVHFREHLLRWCFLGLSYL